MTLGSSCSTSCNINTLAATSLVVGLQLTSGNQERRVPVHIGAVARSDRMLLKQLQKVTAEQQDYKSAAARS
jgi:hypothetical protein